MKLFSFLSFCTWVIWLGQCRGEGHRRTQVRIYFDKCQPHVYVVCYINLQCLYKSHPTNLISFFTHQVDGWNPSDFNDLHVEGTSVALSADGKTVAVGNKNFDSKRGSVKLYRVDDLSNENTPGETGGFTSDQLGISVSLSSDGRIYAAGAPRYGQFRGLVLVDRLDQPPHQQLIDGEFFWDRFGWSVSVSGDGNTLAIGAPCHGDVWVYSWNVDKWSQFGPDIDGDDAYRYFG